MDNLARTAVKEYDYLSSLALELGFPVRLLYSLSNGVWKHYREVTLPKRDGGSRTLSVPDEKLKAVQRRIADVLLPLVPVSPFACAYKKGSDTVKNAMPHVRAPVILKLDVHKFFDSIIFPQVKNKAFPRKLYSEKIRILLTILCMYKEALPQGSPASPGISNIIMRDFDDIVGTWCKERGIAYTRYCDDMTFSGDFDPGAVIDLVRCELRKMGLFLNNKKTVIARNGQKKQVCGIIVNEKISVPKEYRREIRKEVYYCCKYGVVEHLKRTGRDEDPLTYLRGLAGRISYVKSVYSRDDCEYTEVLTGYLRMIKEEIGKLSITQNSVIKRAF